MVVRCYALKVSKTVSLNLKFLETPEKSPAPKKTPYRPPGARAMPGMGFGMGGGIGNELAGKLKSRNKAVESEEKTTDSDDKPSPPVPKLVHSSANAFQILNDPYQSLFIKGSFVSSYYYLSLFI